MPTSNTQAPDKYTQILISLQSLLDAYVSPHLPPVFSSLLDFLLASAIQATPYISQLTSTFYSLITSLSGTSKDSKDGSGRSAESTALLATAIMIISLYVGLRTMNYLRRMVIGWIIFAIKFIAILVAVQMMFYVNRYGWEKMFKDVAWWGGIVWGFVEDALESGVMNRATEAGTGYSGAQVKPPPRGTRSRASARKANNQRGYYGREQVPVGGRARWA